MLLYGVYARSRTSKTSINVLKNEQLLSRAPVAAVITEEQCHRGFAFVNINFYQLILTLFITLFSQLTLILHISAPSLR